MKIESVDLSVWFDDGNHAEINLSPMQTLMVLKLLGIEPAGKGCINCYSDQTLKRFTCLPSVREHLSAGYRSCPAVRLPQRESFYPLLSQDISDVSAAIS